MTPFSNDYDDEAEMLDTLAREWECDLCGADLDRSRRLGGCDCHCECGELPGSRYCHCVPDVMRLPEGL